ncbi:hypothetical protein ABU614_01180 [Lysobacter firmicutimachus]|uniref:Uncharacterized protein n=1 Tax=Lysobacter firmicutimachus TaxID=1792846 RepID=A0AAU8MSB1_9GAMM
MTITYVSWGRWILMTAVRKLGTTYALTELDDGSEGIEPMSPEAAEAVAEFSRKTGSAL